MTQDTWRDVSAAHAVLRFGVAILAALGLFALSTSTFGGARVHAASGVQLPAGFTSTVIATGGSLTQPDDITRLGDRIFVAYQNGVGAMGEPSSSGQTQSTIVEYTSSGSQRGSWSVVGKVDGMTADREGHRIVATVNEDGSSSLYTLTVHGPNTTVRHYTYPSNPLPHGGGTDSIAVVHGALFITASAPSPDANGTTYSGPALYEATLSGTTATLKPVLMDNSTAIDAITGKTVTLNLSDPDSSEIVPSDAPRFAGDLMLDSQGDGEQIYISDPGTADQTVTVLPLNTQIDDTAFVGESWGTLYVTDNSANELIAIRGPFRTGQVFTAVPNDSTALTGTIGQLNVRTGTISVWATGITNSHGLLYVPGF